MPDHSLEVWGDAVRIHRGRAGKRVRGIKVHMGKIQAMGRGTGGFASVFMGSLDPSLEFLQQSAAQ